MRVHLLHAQGNPLFTLELVKALHATGKLTVASDSVTFATGSPPEVLPRCERPLMLQGLKMDHMKPVQQVILKAASVIGETFKFATLMDVFPLDVRDEGFPWLCRWWRVAS